MNWNTNMSLYFIPLLMRNSWLKLCTYINDSWFPSRKHTQVLRFFQSHDYMIYSERGPLWADLVWKSALLHKCEILEDLYQRLVPEKGDHSTIPSVIRACFDTCSRMTSLFLAPYSPFPNLIEMEGFDQMSLHDAMDAEWQDITADQYQEG